MTEPAGGRPSHRGRAFGYLLLFLGAAWILLTGGCTLSFAFPTGGAGGMTTADPAEAAIFIGMAVVCLAPGAVCLYAGRLVLRRTR